MLGNLYNNYTLKLPEMFDIWKDRSFMFVPQTMCKKAVVSIQVKPQLLLQSLTVIHILRRL